MRYEQIKDRQSYGAVDVAAVWPAMAQVAPLPVLEMERGADAIGDIGFTPAAPDVPAAVGAMIALAYAALVQMLIVPVLLIL